MTQKHIDTEFAKWEQNAILTVKAIANASTPEERNQSLTALIEIGVPEATKLIRKEEIGKRCIAEQEQVDRDLNRRQALAAAQAVMLPG